MAIFDIQCICGSHTQPSHRVVHNWRKRVTDDPLGECWRSVPVTGRQNCLN